MKGVTIIFLLLAMGLGTWVCIILISKNQGPEAMAGFRNGSG